MSDEILARSGVPLPAVMQRDGSIYKAVVEGLFGPGPDLQSPESIEMVEDVLRALAPAIADLMLTLKPPRRFTSHVKMPHSPTECAGLGCR